MSDRRLPASARPNPFARRTSGVLLHPTSLPGPHGNGDLGPECAAFAEAIAGAGQTFWQTLPIGPVGRGYSPYDSESSFAGNPMLIGLAGLYEAGLLTGAELEAPPALGRGPARFAAAERFRTERLRRAWERHAGRPRGLRTSLEAFRERAQGWLPDYTLYRALRAAHRGDWTTWEPSLRDRQPAALARARRELAAEIDYHEVVQLLFDVQWRALRDRCRALGLELLGDVPMFVAHDSAEVWSSRELFHLDAAGQCTVVAGVPPDAFSRSGQRWGNPLYRWERMRTTGYRWWVERLAATLERFDAVRLDHFIAFHRYWEVPASSRTARRGRFVPGPGADLFLHLRRALGGLPFVAEDLGLVTPEVTALRESLGLPGMRVLEFAFDDGDGGREYLPHRYPTHTVAYTGTHDNDTARGWFAEKPRPGDAKHRAALARRRARVLTYLGTEGADLHWDLIGAAMRSAANTVVVPVQDLLGLDSRARMNVPGTPVNNWRWRLDPGALDPRSLDRLAALTTATERERPAAPRRRAPRT